MWTRIGTLEMREIKFRAWDIENKMMFAVIKIDFKDEKAPYHVGYFENPYWGTRNPRKERLVIMQYTNLKDKNGVEIYEGDVLKNPEKTNSYQRIHKRMSIGVVEWSDKEAMFVLRWWGAEGMSCTPPMANMVGRYNEVIGSIYENPELMEDKNND